MPPKSAAPPLVEEYLPDGRKCLLSVSGDLLFLEVKSSDGRRLFRRKVVKSNATEWIVSQLGVAVDMLPQVLLDALRSSGEFLHSNCAPCVE